MCYQFLFVCSLACLFVWQPAAAQTEPKISIEVVKDIIKSMPSPLEISFLLRDLEVPYLSEYMLRTDIPAHTVDAPKQALLLGAHITDAGYDMVYEKNAPAIAHFEVCNHLAAALKAEKSFDIAQLQKISEKKDLDMFLTVMTKQADAIIGDLLEHNAADNIKVLMGVWLESLYISVLANQKRPSELLSSRIIDEELILAQVAILLSFYEEGNKDITALLQDLKTLETLYEPIEIKPDGELIRDMKKITAYIIKLRNQWIQG